MDKAKANALYSKGKYNEAARAYTELLSQHPDLPDLLSNRAACFVMLGRYLEALQDCETALAFSNVSDRLRAKLLFRKSVCLSSLNRRSEALHALRACPLSDPAIAAAVSKERLKFRTLIPIEVVKELPQELLEVLPTKPEQPRPSNPLQNLPVEPSFAAPSRPLTYSGILLATKRMSKQASQFWQSVDPDEICSALKTSGIEPEMLDFFTQYAAYDQSHGKRLLMAASKCPRYDFAKIMATVPAGVTLP